MTLAQTLDKSVNNLRVLVEIDISQLNEQWVNYGAGIWQVNAENTYSFVSADLLNGFTAQDFGYIGSVYIDSIQLTRVDTLAEITTTPESFFYDHDTRTLYVRLVNYDNPLMHVVHIGIITPVSYNDFDISGLDTHVSGRLKSIPDISIERDILFWGRLRYGGGSIQLINSDGEYDSWGEDNNLFGNEVRVKIGNPDLTYNEFETISTRNIETVSVSEGMTDISIIDRRKYLSERLRYTCTAKNAVEAIQEILVSIGYTYGSTLYDTTAWQTAIDNAPDVTVRMDLLDADEDEEAITVIEWNSLAAFGTLQMTSDNKFTFVITDTTKAAAANIMACDVRNKTDITYDPSEVITQAKIGYARNWSTDAYTYYTDATRQTTVFKKYKTLKQQLLETVLPDLPAATSFAETFLDYTQYTKGTFNVTVPLKYYAVELGDSVNIDIKRECNTNMLGEKKCEVIGKRYVLDNLAISFKLRITSEQDTVLLSPDDEYLLSPDGAILIAG